jgi:hypothetical protein
MLFRPSAGCATSRCCYAGRAGTRAHAILRCAITWWDCRRPERAQHCGCWKDSGRPVVAPRRVAHQGISRTIIPGGVSNVGPGDTLTDLSTQ